MRINPETVRIAAGSCPFGLALDNEFGLGDQLVVSPIQADSDRGQAQRNNLLASGTLATGGGLRASPKEAEQLAQPMDQR